jgi:hypothetical protein
MSMKGTIYTSGFDQQIDQLRKFPQIADTVYGDAMSESMLLAQVAIGNNTPRRSGAGANAIRSKMGGHGFSVKGEVGWWDERFMYLNVLEYGNKKPYEIPKEKMNHPFLRFAGVGGLVFKRIVEHPQMAPIHFVRRGFDSVRGAIAGLFSVATDAAVEQLAVLNATPDAGARGGGND